MWQGSSFHKSKERPWALTKEGPTREVKKDHEGLKAQKRKKKKALKSQHQGPTTSMCPFKALRRRPWLTHGKGKVYVQIPSKSH